jgi:hypothetical protein
VAFCGALLISSGTAFAQAQKGNSEIKLSGSVQSLSVNSTNTISGQFNFGFGYFVTNGLELGASPGFSVTTTGGVTTTSVTGFTNLGFPILTTTTSARETTTDPNIGFFVRQHFGRARVAPYVGGLLNIFHQSGSGGEASSNQTFGGIEGGLKNYLSEKTALDVNVFVGGQLNTPQGETSLTNVTFSVGITHLF